MNVANLQHIAEHLLINVNDLDSLGLFHGKMGIALFFSHYARCLASPVYEEWAGEVVDQIYAEIHHDVYQNFDDGLYGIGWGFAELLQNHFMEGDPVSVLSNIDRKVMERDIRRVDDWNEFDGLGGLLHYVLKRLSLSLTSGTICPFDAVYLHDLENTCMRFLENEKMCSEYRGTVRAAHAYSYYRKQNVIDSQELLTYKDILVNVPDKYTLLKKLPLGLSDGCAGIGLKSLLL